MDLIHVFIFAIGIFAELLGQPLHYAAELGPVAFLKLLVVSFVFAFLQLTAAGATVAAIMMKILLGGGRNGRPRHAGR